MADHTAMSENAQHTFSNAAQRVAKGADHHYEARSIVELMTLDEKLSCLDGDTAFWPGMMDMTSGGYHRHPWPAAVVPRLGIPGIQFSDGPRGCVTAPATAFPVSMARGASFEPDLEREIGRAIGKELRAAGATYTGAVCMNLLRHPAWGRAQETYGEDPLHVGVMAEALTLGLQEHVMACMKHFALNSMENARFTVDVNVSEEALHEVYLPHFKRVADAGVASVMSAYNSMNGEWCGENTTLLTTILRDEWGWDGFVTSDFVFGLRDAVKSMKAGLNIEMPFMQQRAMTLMDAITNGTLDVRTVNQRVEETLATLLRFNYVFDNEQPPEILACTEHRALAHRAAVRSMVLLRNVGPLLPVDASTLKKVVVLGRLAAIPNLGDGGSSNVFPPQVITPLDGIRTALPKSDVRHYNHDASESADADLVIVVVGYTKHDEGEWLDQTDTAKLFGLFPPVDHPILGFAPNTKGEPKIGEATPNASSDATGDASADASSDATADTSSGASSDATADTSSGASSEQGEDRAFAKGGDRSTLRLSSDDEGLIAAARAANDNVVVCVMSGSAVVMPWLDSVPATLMIWYPGMEGGRALADVLFGIEEPGGRLPFVVPADEADLVHFDRDAVTETYDLFHGQWLLDRNGVAPHRSFGFGLGYTTFALSDAAYIDDSDRNGSDRTGRVQVTVKNTGARRGSTVVQVYAVHDPDQHADQHADQHDQNWEQARQVRKLVGFRRVFLEASAAESCEIVIDMAPLQKRMNGRMELPAGPLSLYVGQSWEDSQSNAVTTLVR
jgi:beta-glucosidase